MSTNPKRNKRNRKTPLSEQLPLIPNPNPQPNEPPPAANDDQEKAKAARPTRRTAKPKAANTDKEQCGGFEGVEADVFRECCSNPNFATMALTPLRHFARSAIGKVPSGTQFSLRVMDPDDPRLRLGGVGFSHHVHTKKGEKIRPKKARSFPIPVDNYGAQIRSRTMNRRLDLIFAAVRAHLGI